MIVQRGTRVAAYVLIALGLILLVGQWLGVGGEAVVAVIGIAFLVAYSATSQYGFLIPGAIMTGLGVGIIYQTRYGGGAAVVLGLGLGFVAIYVAGAVRHQFAGNWWPLIPGGVLTGIGLLAAANQQGLAGDVARWWPVLLIAFGLYLIVRRREAP